MYGRRDTDGRGASVGVGLDYGREGDGKVDKGGVGRRDRGV